MAFIEAILGQDLRLHTRAELELNRFQAVRRSAQLVPFYRSRWTDEISTWIAAFEPVLHYNEPGGEWILRGDTIWERQSRYADTPVADDIAWFAVLNGYPGECEGIFVCYLARVNAAEGEYLRRQPTGTRADSAAQQIARVAALREELKSIRGYFDQKNDCGEMRTVVESLRTAVLGSTASSREQVAAELSAVLELCK